MIIIQVNYSAETHTYTQNPSLYCKNHQIQKIYCHWYFLLFFSHSLYRINLHVYICEQYEVGRLINCKVAKTSTASALVPMPQIPKCMQFCAPLCAQTRVNETKQNQKIERKSYNCVSEYIDEHFNRQK